MANILSFVLNFSNIELIVTPSQSIHKAGVKTGFPKEQDFHAPRTGAFNN